MFKFGKLRSGMSRHSNGMGGLSVVGYQLIKYKDDKAKMLKFTFQYFYSIFEDCKTKNK